jgi:hypothetical protein
MKPYYPHQGSEKKPPQDDEDGETKRDRLSHARIIEANGRRKIRSSKPEPETNGKPESLFLALSSFSSFLFSGLMFVSDFGLRIYLRAPNKMKRGPKARRRVGWQGRRSKGPQTR